MGTMTKLPPRPYTREPMCRHSGGSRGVEQPASCCASDECRRLTADWRGAWDAYNRAALAQGNCEFRTITNPLAASKGDQYCVTHRCIHYP